MLMALRSNEYDKRQSAGYLTRCRAVNVERHGMVITCR